MVDLDDIRVIDNEIVVDERPLTVERILTDVIKRYRADTWRFATGYLFFDGWKIVKQAIPPNLRNFYILFGFTDEAFAPTLASSIDENELQVVLAKLSEKLSDDALEYIVTDDTFKALSRSGVLKVRWINRLHSKLFLFTKNEEDSINLEGKAIVGSSNITARGLSRPGELNIFVQDRRDIGLLLDWFKRRWEEGKDLSADVILNAIANEHARRNLIRSGKFIDNKKEELTLLDGYLFLFWYLLNGVYDLDKIRQSARIEGVSKISAHNRDAVLWGYQILKKYRGVILADPVGMGKSFQAMGLMAALREQEGVSKFLLVVPPHLINNGQWEDYLREFFPNGGHGEPIEGISTSKKILFHDKKGDFEVALVSSYGLALLSEKSPVLDVLADYDVLLVDEAHHFKNPNAKRRIILNAIVDKHRQKYGDNPYTLLLTATPIVNDVLEIMSLMSIYTRDDGENKEFGRLARVRLEDNPLRHFEKYKDYLRRCTSAESAEQRKEYCELKTRELQRIKEFLQETVILRSKSYVAKKYPELGKLVYPKLHSITYEYTPGEEKWVQLIEDLTLDYLRLSPSQYIMIPTMNISGGKLQPSAEVVTLPAVMKILLAKRLESSVYAFLKTLWNMRDTMKALLPYVEKRDPEKIATVMVQYRERKRNMLEDADFGGLLEEDDRILERKTTIRNHILEIEGILPDIAKNIRKDLDLIDKTFKDLGLDPNRPPHVFYVPATSKEKKLMEYLKKKFEEGKKVIVFTMFVDTAEYLIQKIYEAFPDEKVPFHIITGETEGRRAIIDKFRDQKYGVLVATDALSEGVNLEFIDELVNYDIPWTPSVLLQRVGRLWRFGREKDIHFHNFFPPTALEEAFNSITARIEEKLSAIRDVLVQEIKLLRESEELTDDFESRVYGNVYEQDAEKKDIVELIRSIAESDVGALEAKILENINTDTLPDGTPVRSRVEVLEPKFRKLLAEIESNNRIINLSVNRKEFKPFAIVRFGKRYWFDLSAFKVSDDSLELADEIERRWNFVKSYADYPLRWRHMKQNLDPNHILPKFRIAFKTYVVENLKEVSETDALLLENFVLAAQQKTLLKSEQKLLEDLKTRAFMAVAYHLYNRKMSSSRRRAIDTLRDLGFVDKSGKPVFTAYNNSHLLQELLERLEHDVEPIHVEVLL